MKLSDEEIYKLRKVEKKSYTEIGRILNISVPKASKLCKEIFEEKGEEDLPLKRGRKSKFSETLDDIIFEMCESGLTHQQITDILSKKGIKVSRSFVQKKCKMIYSKKGKKQPREMKKDNMKDIKEKIYKMKEDGLADWEIVEELKKDGFCISTTSVASYRRKIYQEKQQAEPKLKRGKNFEKRREAINRIIYKLREDRLTQEEILETLHENGIKMELKTLRRRLKDIYGKLGKNQPVNYGRKKIVLDMERIYSEYYEKKSSFEKIQQIMEIEYGTKVSAITIRKRLNEYITQRNTKVVIQARGEKQVDAQEIIDKILKLKDSRNATLEQMEEIAKIYGVDLNMTADRSDER